MAALTDQIALTRDRASARHVPDEIIAAPGIPLTHAGKRIEVPIKRLFTGRAPTKVVNTGSLTNPQTVDFCVRQATAFLARQHR